MNNALDLIRWAKKELEHSDVPRAARNAEEIFMHSFSASREDIYSREDLKLRANRINLFRYYVALRANRFPLQYIIKNVEFMGLALMLERGVFIPRPETELLVEKLLGHIKTLGKKVINILDVGTGCGNIAISLTKNAAGCRIIASDISRRALGVAAKNARMSGTKSRIKFIQSNYFDNISSVYYNYFDIIVSNPPYIRSGAIRHLQPEIAHEDIRALDGGEDGLYAYRRILSDGTRFLKKGGIFAFEIGYDQAPEVTRLVKKDGRFSEAAFYKDYNGHRRILITRNRRKR